VDPHETDVIEAGREPVARQRMWAAAVVVLAIALTAAVIAAVHFHAVAVAEDHPTHQVSVVVSPGSGHLALSARTSVLPSSGRLTGEVTIFAVQPANGAAQVEFSGRISGGLPHKRYALVGNDCTGTADDHTWSAGVTDARGLATLTGRAWTVSAADEYWLWLTPWPHAMEPGLHGSLTAGGSLTAFRAGQAPCTP
jgi:hypothetical protein